jgi:hypothetical protein
MYSIDLGAARRIGKLVPPTGMPILRGVHTNVINLEFRDHRGAFFVSVVHRIEDVTELGILVSPHDWETIRNSLPAVGTGVVYTIVLQDNPELPTGQEVTSPGPENHIGKAHSITPKELAEHIATGFCIPPRGLLSLVGADTEQRRQAQTDPFLRRTGEVLNRIDGSPSGQLDLSPLVGLGIGFTPAGDDFVAGAYVAETIISRTPTFRTIDTDALWHRLEMTTTGGATLLRLVLENAPPAYLPSMVHALLNGDGPGAARIAEGHGHTSGFDALAGIIWRIKRRIDDIMAGNLR